VRTLLPEPLPAEVRALLERRRRLGQDRKDEVWEGVLHVVPAPSVEHAVVGAQVKRLLATPATGGGMVVTDDFNLGHSSADFRVPDGGLHRDRPRGTWVASAALILEILSPEDETWEKLPFYAAHGVDEVLIVDVEEKRVHWLALLDGAYHSIERSGLVDLRPTELEGQIDWP